MPIVVDDGSPPPDRTNARVYHPTAKPGGRAPHVALGGGRSTLDLFGAGFTLLRTRAELDPTPFERVAREGGVPLRIATAPEIAQAYDGALVLVRPDGCVAWRGDAIPAAPDAILDTVRGA